jgi:predicted ATP-dependent serine protease
MVSMRKMTSGWSNVDKILSGGWDHATLNLIMGETNVGKCFISSELRVKNKKTGEIKNIKVEDFYNQIKTNLIK